MRGSAGQGQPGPGGPMGAKGGGSAGGLNPSQGGQNPQCKSLATSINNTVMELRKIANHPLLRSVGW